MSYNHFFRHSSLPEIQAQKMSEDSRRLFIFECETKPEALILAKQFESKYNSRNKYSNEPEVKSILPESNIDIQPLKEFADTGARAGLFRRLSSIQKYFKIVNYEPKQQINHAIV